MFRPTTPTNYVCDAADIGWVPGLLPVAFVYQGVHYTRLNTSYHKDGSPRRTTYISRAAAIVEVNAPCPAA